MMRRPWRLLALGGALVVALLVGGRLVHAGTEVPLATFAWQQDVLCPAYASVPGVTGMLHGDPTATPPVWLEHDGRRLYIRWPAGFRLMFDPQAVLYDTRGSMVGREGETVRLPQVNLNEHAGTLDDPYLAHGDVGTGCYVPAS